MKMNFLINKIWCKNGVCIVKKIWIWMWLKKLFKIKILNKIQENFLILVFKLSQWILQTNKKNCNYLDKYNIRKKILFNKSQNRQKSIRKN